MALRTIIMKNIWDSFDGQLTKLQELTNNIDQESTEIRHIKINILINFHEFNKQLSRFLSRESTDYSDMNKRIVQIIDEFGSVSIGANVSDCQYRNVIPKVQNNFLSALVTMEKLKYATIKQELLEALNYIVEMGNVTDIEDFQNIKELGSSLSDMIRPLQLHARNLISTSFKEKIILYTCQLSIGYAILALVVQEQHNLNLPIYRTKSYACNRIAQCLKLIIDVLEAPNPTEDEEILEKEDHFVYKMDLALDLISSISGKIDQQEQVNLCNDLWMSLEDVFSHTMMIAQVCRPEYFQPIMGASKAVVNEFETLKRQLTTEIPDKALNNLFINTFTNSLYRLERQVNISMLALVMEVFSEPFYPLKKLIRLCGNSLPAKTRHKNDLSDAIEAFDQITDKIMQIGLYTMACCSDVNKVANIRNFMANLESLDLELITSITSFYLEPNNIEHHTCVKLLTTQWQYEVSKFHKCINLIIDSAAYCQVILEDVQNKFRIISDSFENRQDISVAQIKTIIYRACALATQITAAVEDIGLESIDKQTIMMIKEFKAATFETDAAAKSLLRPNSPAPEQLRVIKRCELLLNVIKRLQPVLVTVMSKSQSSDYTKKSHFGQSALQDIRIFTQNKTDTTFIKTPYTATNYKLPVSIQLANSSPNSSLDMNCLIPYIKKGQLMRSEKSIMYKTPKTQQSDLKKIEAIPKLSCVRQHLFSRDSFCSNESVDLSNISFELSEILTEMSAISHDSSFAVLSNLPVNPIAKNEMDPCTDRSESNYLTNGDDGSDVLAPMINTFERMDDIKKLEKKLRILHKQKN